MIDGNSELIKFWDALLGLNFLFGQFYTLMRLAFNRAFRISNSPASTVFIIVLEICWIMDVFVNSIKVTPKMKNPSLKKTISRYIFNGTFIFDLIPAFIGNSLFIFTDSVTLHKISDNLKLLRFARAKTLQQGVYYFVEKAKAINSRNNEFFQTLFALILYNLLALHLLSCMWIYIGTESVTAYTTDTDRTDKVYSWLFVSQGSFRGDGKTMYD